ncbi:hypothetical protein M440DRAFT_1377562 [Trichoderma longibrachiatum ATCC 18648]|uniref:F-box domain-containing protein n=1 Tax=Trichoderma longibrachiatum ATCC 18648 TaxID=983965 RepID=A0A2T4C4J7_TRILO|nr:hypothetical protein M440DRAFT_1377562 [Trichoderma longibrachiatum ATCC 18648]
MRATARRQPPILVRAYCSREGTSLEDRDEQLPRLLYANEEQVSECPLLQLPQELFYMILSRLLDPWLLSLSLTCKTFWTGMEKEDLRYRVVFLSALQRDLPNTYFCFCCCKLRRLQPGGDWNSQPHRFTPGPYHPRSWWLSEQSNIWHVPTPYHYPTFKSHFHIDFTEAYLIMNSHFLGPSHGLPLKSLERFVAFQDHIELNMCQPSGAHGSHPADQPRTRQGMVGLCYNPKEEMRRLAGLWRFSHEMIPRIVDDKLYLARFYKIIGPLVPWQCLARLISSLEPEVCRHLWCSAGSSPPFCNLVPAVRNTNDSQRKLLGNGLYMMPSCISPESNSCLTCNTDYDISVYQDKDKSEWVFSLSAYHCLGSCRTPSEELWSWFVHDLPGRPADGVSRREDRPRRVSRLQKLAGTARRKWTRGGQSQEG